MGPVPWGCSECWAWASYRTAWSLLHKLRRAMVRPGREPLQGLGEVDETSIGATKPGQEGRRLGTRALVVAAVEADGKRIGRIRLRRVTSPNAQQLLGFVGDAVATGTVVRTDGWSRYRGLTGLGYPHEVRIVGKRPAAASRLLARVHLVFKAAQTLAVEHASRRGGSPPFGLLPRRIHFSLQSAPFGFPRKTLLPPPTAGRRHRSPSLHFPARRQTSARTTTHWVGGEKCIARTREAGSRSHGEAALRCRRQGAG